MKTGLATGLAALRVLAEGLDHPEGVTVTSTGVLYAGGEAGQVYRVDQATGTVEQIASTKGFLLGLCADGSGHLYCCDVARRQVLRVFTSNGDVEVYSRGTRHRPMVNPNWPVFDDRGNLYVTDSGTWKGNDGCIFRVAPGGSTEVWCEESTNFPNGACLTESGDALLVLESCTPALVRIPILPNGAPGPRVLVATLDGVPDGVTLDEEGAAYICFYRPDRIDRVHPDGKMETLAEDPEGTLLSAPTNGVWIDEARDVLVVGNLGRWHLTACEWDVRGLALRYPELPA